MQHSYNLKQETLNSLTLACRYWELAKIHRRWRDGKDSYYYTKAYHILQQEMGNKNSFALELRQEMTANH